jgi:F-type H+-transporting ATPase subunit alpha
LNLLKQKQYSPFEVEDQVISIYAATKGFFDGIDKTKIGEAESGLLDFLKSKHSDVVESIKNEKQVTADNETKLVEAIKSFVNANY